MSESALRKARIAIKQGLNVAYEVALHYRVDFNEVKQQSWFHNAVAEAMTFGY